MRARLVFVFGPGRARARGAKKRRERAPGPGPLPRAREGEATASYLSPLAPLRAPRPRPAASAHPTPFTLAMVSWGLTPREETHRGVRVPSRARGAGAIFGLVFVPARQKRRRADAGRGCSRPAPSPRPAGTRTAAPGCHSTTPLGAGAQRPGQVGARGAHAGRLWRRKRAASPAALTLLLSPTTADCRRLPPGPPVSQRRRGRHPAHQGQGHPAHR